MSRLQIPVFTLQSPPALAPKMAMCPRTYQPRWPAVQAALQAAEQLAAQQSANPQAPFLGLGLAELATATSIPKAVLSTLVGQYLQRGYLHAAGPRSLRHYFLSATAAQAAQPLIEQAAQQAKQATRQRKNQRERARHVPAPPSRQRRAEAALAAAASGGLSPAELCAATGCTDKQLHYLITRLRAAGTVGQTGRGASARYYGGEWAQQARQAKQQLQDTAAALRQQAAADKLAARQAKAATKALKASMRQQQLQQRAAAREQQAQQQAAQLAAKREQAAQREQRRLQRQQDQAQQQQRQADKARKRQPDARTTIVPRDARPGAAQLAKRPAAAPAPVQVRQTKPTEPVPVTYAPDFKHTVVAAPKGRYAVDDGPVIGGFSTMRPGQYLPDEGFSRYLGQR